MYQTSIKGDKLYHTVSSGYGRAVELFGATENGETPMSLLNIALASCVTMCVQGYFKRVHGLVKLAVDVQSSYEEGQFRLSIDLEQVLAEDEKAAILDYVDQQCRVKKFLHPDVVVEVGFGGVNG